MTTNLSLEGLTHCNHERADTQIFLHSKHTAADGNTIMNKASDTYVLVISVSVLFILQDLGVEKLWVAFGQEQKSGFFWRLDYHYHSVQREKTDSHAEQIPSGHLL
jgi:uncharacterized membrane protein